MNNNIEQDQLYRYLFQDRAVRGEFVRLHETFKSVIENKDYPKPIQNLLGEMLAATSLLTAILKFEGKITLQIQGKGPLELAVINGNHKQELRAVARLKADVADNANLTDIVQNGILAISLTPDKGESYQGIVALDKPTLAECLESYFIQSEQLPTKIVLAADIYNNQPVAAGILVQIMPGSTDEPADFEELSMLTATIKPEELFGLPVNQILYRLYNQETVEIFEPQAVNFCCGCSRERSLEAIYLLSEDERSEILDAEGAIDMLCDYCGTNYIFTEQDLTTTKH